MLQLLSASAQGGRTVVCSGSPVRLGDVLNWLDNGPSSAPDGRASLGLRLCEGRHGMSVLLTRVPSIVRGPWMTCAEWGLSRLWLQVHQTLSSLGSDHPSFFFPRTPFVSSESSPYTLLNRGRQALYHGSTQVNPEAEISTSRERLVQVTRRPLSPLII